MELYFTDFMDLVRAFYMVVILHELLDSGMYIVNNLVKKGGEFETWLIGQWNGGRNGL